MTLHRNKGSLWAAEREAGALESLPVSLWDWGKQL
jgi:hypothetical protein